MASEDFFHKIRNQLTVIKGNLDLIKPDRLDPETQKLLQAARHEIQILAQLINQAED